MYTLFNNLSCAVIILIIFILLIIIKIIILKIIIVIVFKIIIHFDYPPISTILYVPELCVPFEYQYDICDFLHDGHGWT